MPVVLLGDSPLVVFVGLTAVGKTTAVEGLLALRQGLELLPNRRWIADRLVLPAMLEELGEEIAPVTDRRRRFELTRLYRQRFEGGLAHALATLELDASRSSPSYVFDGLRGIDEVRWACAKLPRSRFVVLDAPDSVRLRRLLGRGESFDRAVVGTTFGERLEHSLASVAGIGDVFSASEVRALSNDELIQAHSTAEVIEKVTILVEERRNYDSREAAEYLEAELPAERILQIDTSSVRPRRVASLIAEWSASELE